MSAWNDSWIMRNHIDLELVLGIHNRDNDCPAYAQHQDVANAHVQNIMQKGEADNASNGCLDR